MTRDFEERRRRSERREAAEAAPTPGKVANTDLLQRSFAGPMPTVPGKLSAMEVRSSLVPRIPGKQTAAELLPAQRGSGLPPELRARFERSLGVDLGNVRVHAGTDAAERADAAGARAFATGDDIVLGRGVVLGTPDGDRILAEEVAHTVQQRGASRAFSELPITSKGEDVENEADQAARAMLFGAPATVSAHPLAIARSPNPQAIIGNAAKYLFLNARQAGTAIQQHFASVTLPKPHPRLSWNDRDAFLKGLYKALNWLLFDFENPSELRQVLHPADPYALIDEMRPIIGIEKATAGKKLTGGRAGPCDWRPSIGVALGALFEAAVVKSLLRLGPRWVAIADRMAAENSRPAPDASYQVEFDALPLSHHIDRAVGRAMCSPLVFEFQPAPKAKEDVNTRVALRPVKLEWQGAKDAKLWNWVRVIEPADASVEEVAASLFAYTADAYQEKNTSFLAYGITATPPLFGIPASWALNIDEAKRFAPAKITNADDHTRSHVLSLAGSTIGDELALVEASKGVDAANKATAGEANTLALIEDAMRQATHIKTTLKPWKVAGPLDRTVASSAASSSRSASCNKPRSGGRSSRCRRRTSPRSAVRSRRSIVARPASGLPTRPIRARMCFATCSTCTRRPPLSLT